ncbi:Pyruvate dehydrogenase E1 component [compost metagenome]
MGKSGEARNTAHQTKKLDDAAVKEMRDRFNIPIPDDKLPEVPFFKPSDDTPEMQYLHERRKALGGYLPQRRVQADEKLVVPELSAFQAVLDPTAEGHKISTTQAYVRIITTLLRDASLGKILGPSFAQEAMPDVIEKLIDVYIEQRTEDERFIDTYQRIGIDLFKERVYAANH